MAIRKDGSELVCECEECGDIYYGGTIEDFTTFVKELRKDGWNINKEEGGWHHSCPNCARSR